MAHVAGAQKAVAPQRSGLAIGAVVRHVVGGLGAQADLARLARRQRGPVVAGDAQLHAVCSAAHGAGVGQPLGAGTGGDDAGLGHRVVLADHRAPPVDHAALDVGRAGRGAVHHAAQAGQVVPPPDVVRQLQQAHEHRRHHVQVRDAVLLDQRQQPGGVEAGLQHQQPAAAHHVHAVGVGRRVVQRPGHHRAGPGLTFGRCQAPGQQRAALRRRGHLGRHLGRALHTLGQAGGARGVEHGPHDRHRRGGPGLHLGQGHLPAQGVVGAEGRARVGGTQFVRRVDHQHPHAHRRGHLLQAGREEIGMHHQRTGFAVAQDVVGLVGREVPVQRHGAGAQQRGALGGLEEREVVAQQQGHALALAQPQAGECRRRPAAAQRQAVGAKVPRATDDAAGDIRCHGVTIGPAPVHRLCSATPRY